MGLACLLSVRQLIRNVLFHFHGKRRVKICLSFTSTVSFFNIHTDTVLKCKKALVTVDSVSHWQFSVLTPIIGCILMADLLCIGRLCSKGIWGLLKIQQEITLLYNSSSQTSFRLKVLFFKVKKYLVKFLEKKIERVEIETIFEK